MLAHSFIPVINKPTRAANNVSTLIDNMFLKSCNTNFSSCIICSDISDHYPLALTINLHMKQLSNKRSSKKRNFSIANIENLRSSN